MAYALEPWRQWGYDDVRLFSVLDARAVNVAFALSGMCLERGQSSREVEGRTTRPEPLRKHLLAFRSSPTALAAALADYRGRPSADPEARQLAEFWRNNLFAAKFLPAIEAADPRAVEAAVELLATRAADLERVLAAPGYLLPEDFGGWMPVGRGR